jgi:hypothetical protein
MGWFDILKTPFDTRAYDSELQEGVTQEQTQKKEELERNLKSEMSIIDTRLKKAMALNPQSKYYKIPINTSAYKKMRMYANSLAFNDGGMVDGFWDKSNLKAALLKEYTLFKDIELKNRLADRVFIFHR